MIKASFPGWVISQFPDLYISGAALVSKEENHNTYIGQAVVDDPEGAAAKA
jgi:hypothetical protein